MDEKRRQVILIADDSEMNREILADMLGRDYQILEAENGLTALRIVKEREDAIDLLLLDINMPVLDGFGVLEALNRNRRPQDLPVVMISSENGSDFIERSYDLGATDYISRPFDARVVRRRVLNTLMLYAKQKKLSQMVAEQIYEKERNNNMMISILSQILEFRNGESGKHVVNIRAITEILLHRLALKTDRYPLDQEHIALISTASALHDIGKISIPGEILNKPGRLTPEEFTVMKTHSAVGSDMLKSMVEFQDEPLVQAAIEITRWHHERWDGRGYPDGLQGDEIPISAQIVALADVYDALTSERCYKKAFPHDLAVQMILNGECGVFNPLLLECLKDAAQSIPKELHDGALEKAGERQAYSVVEALFEKEDLRKAGRMSWVIEMERARNRFFTARVEEIQFDYNAETDVAGLSEWGARQLGLTSPLLLLGAEGKRFREEPHVQAIAKALRETTPESPEITREMLIPVGGELRWHRLVAKALWFRSDEVRYMGAIGKLSDIHEEYLREVGEISFKGVMDDAGATALIQTLRRVFDVVRLVDVVQAMEIQTEPECEDSCQCYAIWGKAHRCANCISARALHQRTQLTKLEFIGNEIYQVISQYMEISGRPCVMELVIHLQSDVLEGFYRDQDLTGRIDRYRKELYVDSLTGVYNRRYYDDHIEMLDRFAAVIMIDVDDFKLINDTCGHHAGDEALRAIANAMSEITRNSDILLRYGGDEFLLLYPNIPRNKFDEKLEQLQAAVRKVRLPEYPQISLSISAGGVYGVHPVAHAVQLADKRMYESKACKKLARSSGERG